jgi:hypothetical protein
MRNRSLIVYDVIGAAVTCAAAALGIWSAFFHVQISSNRLQGARDQVSKSTAQLAEVELALRQTQTERARLAADIAERGALPQNSPIEEDLRNITQLARGSGVELVNVAPMPAQKYPGLLEQRYTMQTRSDFPGLVSFLHQFETLPLWADVSGITIGDQARNTGEMPMRTSSLVVSFFASQEDDPVPAPRK